MVRVMLGFVLLVLYLVPLGQAGTGVIDRQVTRGGHPMTLLMPEPQWQMVRHEQEHTEEDEDALLSHPGDPIPAIIVAHGFAGSRQMVAGYGYTLAHAGYAVILVDLPGHGLNENPYDREANVGAIDQALEVLRAQPEVDVSRIGLVGHSMGAEAVLRAASASPERYGAVVAVSPVFTEVSPATPRNLQLQAGVWEPDFLASAEQILADAGGANADFANGRARELVAIPRAEHIGIVFRQRSHRAARDWFDRAFEFKAAGSHDHSDWRLLGWLLHVAGWLLVASAVTAGARRDPSSEIDLTRRPAHWLALFAGPLVATGAVMGLAQIMTVGTLGGVVVGGTLAFWFLIAGTTFLVTGYRAGLPSFGDVARGVGLFVFLSVVIGVTGHLAWANWSPTTSRLLLWPLFAAACTPWFVATEIGQGDPRSVPRPAWWVAQSIAVIVGLYAMTWTVPGMGVVSLMLPLLPAYSAVFVYLGGKVQRPWAYGIGCGLFMGWVLALVFPLVG